MVFRGTWEYTIDDRGRVPLPARYRKDFAGGAVLVEAVDGCLEVHTPESYENLAAFVEQRGPHQLRARRVRRGVFSRSFDAELDAQGRILIPARCRRHAQLEGPVIMAGRGECLEIWSPARWEEEDEFISREYGRDLEAMEERP